MTLNVGDQVWYSGDGVAPATVKVLGLGQICVKIGDHLRLVSERELYPTENDALKARIKALELEQRSRGTGPH